MPVIVQIWDAQNQEVTRRVRATSRRIASKVAEVLHDGPQRLCRKQTGRRHGEDRASYWFKLYTKRTDTPSRGRWPVSAFGGKADMCSALAHVCYGPIAAISNAGALRVRPAEAGGPEFSKDCFLRPTYLARL